MTFHENAYQTERYQAEDQEIVCRVWRNLPYADKPVCPEYQRMHLFAPERYFRGEKINGYTLHTAPVFLPNQMGGYLAALPAEPSVKDQIPNTVFRALAHGYVVAAPAIRGRNLRGNDGLWTGKAPACITDYKAAIRYLHYFADRMPGDISKIITNGTSAGGALSALAGASGDHPDYEPFLKEIGAAAASDRIFAASCYCPITDLEHADMAYEWQFRGIYDYHRLQMKPDEGGRPFFTAKDGTLTELQIQASRQLADRFPDYVNGLKLKDASGKPLELNADGTGSFADHVKEILIRSAEKAMAEGRMPVGESWLTLCKNRVTDVNLTEYARHITRMKTAPAFDDLENKSAENDLFGDAAGRPGHFTELAAAYDRSCGQNSGSADQTAVRMMNPLNYIKDPSARKAPYFRIRHGECDRDTSLAVSAILSLKLLEAGCSVDYSSPWLVPHSGDYDPEELFGWIDSICKTEE